MSHRTMVTTAGTVVNHSHPYPDLSDAEKASIQANALANYPGITPMEYIHLNHIGETLMPTRRYNCWGFTFNPRQCWISTGNDVQHILNDNGVQVFPPNVRVGDVICYRFSGVITHTGRVWSLDTSSNPALIQSKWGAWGEYLHPPLTVPASYGTDVSYWRVTPVGGKGDAWVKDYLADDRLVAPPGVDLYLSPDLWCNNSGGSLHQNPVRNQPNQLWVRVHNPDTLAINNATIRVYWSDPTGGLPHYDWHQIGTVPVSVPAGPGTEAIAGPVMWTPGVLEPQHCCLFAIADTGDDPCAAATLDPIVWPFDVSRDNNIIWKNMWVVVLPPPPPPPPPGPEPSPPGPAPQPPKGALFFDFVVKNIKPFQAQVEVRVNLRQISPEEVVKMGFDPGQAGWSKEIPKMEPIGKGQPAGLTVKIAAEGEAWRKGQGGLLRGTSKTLAMRAVPFGKGGRLRLEVLPTRKARPGQVYRLDLEQRVGRELTGGGAFVVIIKK